MTVLVTGFGPFPGAPWNPSADLVRRLARSRRLRLAGLDLATFVFATSYPAVDRDLPRLLAERRPAAVIMFGLAARTSHLRIECWARNMRSRLLPDVAGHTARTVRIALGQPAFLRGRADFSQLAAVARRAGLPARVSHDAGRYLCNYAYWRLLADENDGMPAVFIHVPRVRRGPVPVGVGLRRRPDMDDLARVAERILRVFGAAARRAMRPRPASGHPGRSGS